MQTRKIAPSRALKTTEYPSPVIAAPSADRVTAECAAGTMKTTAASAAQIVVGFIGCLPRGV
jgi:hypothetical protein